MNKNWQTKKKSIVETLSSYRDEMVELTKALISIPTENPPGKSYLACVETIEHKLKELGMQSTIIEVPDGDESGSEPQNPYPRYNLLSSYGEGKRTVFFHGHYDVVPASTPEQFKPYVSDGKLYGRGSADMKGGIAAMVYAIKTIKDCGIDLDGRIDLVCVPDEETGGVLGTRYLFENNFVGEGGVAMFIPEPSSGLIWKGSRGAISLRITVNGKSAHVGIHYEGINAFEGMLQVTNKLLELKDEIERRKTNFRIEPEDARRSILLLGGVCESGANFNAVPEKCTFTVDRRLNPEEDLEIEKERLFSIFDQLRGEGIDLDVEILQEGNSSGVSESDPVAQVLAESVEAVTGEPTKFELCPGFLETRFYSQLGIPGFSYGPGLLSVSHGPDEYVRIKDMLDCAAIYTLSAVRLLI